MDIDPFIKETSAKIKELMPKLKQEMAEMIQHEINALKRYKGKTVRWDALRHREQYAVTRVFNEGPDAASEFELIVRAIDNNYLQEKIDAAVPFSLDLVSMNDSKEYLVIVPQYSGGGPVSKDFIKKFEAENMPFVLPQSVGICFWNGSYEEFLDDESGISVFPEMEVVTPETAATVDEDCEACGGTGLEPFVDSHNEPRAACGECTGE